ncbi:hypothetical protein [Chryseobacterium sp.]|uniref:hypothetical protein n=1 Tax=Chryseobacterium sp. TaxID=1871047 RepID=UPI00321A9E6D
MSNDLIEALEETRDTLAKVLLKIRRDAPDLSGKLLGHADQVIARVDALLDAPANDLDRDEAIRVWHTHCDAFSSKLGAHPPSPVIDAMLSFAGKSAHRSHQEAAQELSLAVQYEAEQAAKRCDQPASIDLLPHDDILRYACRVLSGDHPTREDKAQARKGLMQLRQSIRPVASPAPSESAAKDAARYRWLRDVGYDDPNDGTLAVFHLHAGKGDYAARITCEVADLDKTIDAAMAASGGESDAGREGK